MADMPRCEPVMLQVAPNVGLELVMEMGIMMIMRIEIKLRRVKTRPRYRTLMNVRVHQVMKVTCTHVRVSTTLKCENMVNGVSR